MFLTLLVLSYFRSPAAALPTSLAFSAPVLPSHLLLDRDTNSSPGCNCSCRTTSSIILNCALTIVACIYSAVHPNIPPPKASTRRQLWETAIVTFFSLFLSELVILWAFSQWAGARHIRKTLTDLAAGLPADSAKKLRKWTLVHAQFLQMGGFSRADNRHVLYLDSLTHLIKTGRIEADSLDVETKDIEDHSKAAWFSKLVAALQILWFGLQCIVRFGQNLVLTELEIVTFAFASLNVVIYIAWWNKPLNVQTRIYLEVKDSPDSEYPDITEVDIHHGPVQMRTCHDPVADIFLGRWHELLEKWCTLHTFGQKAMFFVQLLFSMFLDVVQTIIWSVPNNLISLAGYKIGIPVSSRLQFWVSWPDDGYVHRFYCAIPESGRLKRSLYGALVGSIYGGLHLLGWLDTFPELWVRVLWMISAGYITITPPMAVPFAQLIGVDPANSPFLILCFAIFALGMLGYLVARFFLIMIALVTLRHLSPETFLEIEWVRLIPHL